MIARTLAIGALLVGFAARPGTADAATCSITSVSPVAFGSYDVFDPSPRDSTGGITFQCTGVIGGDTVRIDLDDGAATGFAPRTLISGAFALAYNLYLDAAHTSVWGDGTGGSASYGPVQPAEGSTTITIYGRVPAGQGVPAGAYGDNLLVTLHY